MFASCVALHSAQCLHGSSQETNSSDPECWVSAPSMHPFVADGFGVMPNSVWPCSRSNGQDGLGVRSRLSLLTSSQAGSSLPAATTSRLRGVAALYPARDCAFFVWRCIRWDWRPVFAPTRGKLGLQWAGACSLVWMRQLQERESRRVHGQRLGLALRRPARAACLMFVERIPRWTALDRWDPRPQRACSFAAALLL